MAYISFSLPTSQFKFMKKLCQEKFGFPPIFLTIWKTFLETFFRFV